MALHLRVQAITMTGITLMMTTTMMVLITTFTQDRTTVAEETLVLHLTVITISMISATVVEEDFGVAVTVDVEIEVGILNETVAETIGITMIGEKIGDEMTVILDLDPIGVVEEEIEMTEKKPFVSIFCRSVVVETVIDAIFYI